MKYDHNKWLYEKYCYYYKSVNVEKYKGKPKKGRTESAFNNLEISTGFLKKWLDKLQLITNRGKIEIGIFHGKLSKKSSVTVRSINITCCLKNINEIKYILNLS